MTLTEKWKKGELPEGDYYLDIGSDTIIDYWVCNHWNWTEYDSRIKAVLCEVPTYDEYQQLLSDQLAKNEGVEINAELENRMNLERELCKRVLEENAQLKKWCEEFNALEVANENTKLKELLKECVPFVELCNYTPENRLLLKSINELLGEE